ncbi:hypothetical protein KR067_000283, partial [Drosophila pandora]
RSSRAGEFEVLRKMQISKLTVKMLRVIFKYAQCMGIIFFNIKGVTIFKISWLLWLSVILRLIILCAFIVYYVFYLLIQDNLILIFLQSIRMFVTTLFSYFIVSLQLFKGSEIIKLVGRLLNLFRSTRLLCRQKEYGFREKREFFFIITLMACLFYSIYRFTLHTSNSIYFKDVVTYLCNIYIYLEIHLIFNIHILAYFSFGFLYSEINKYIREFLKHHLRDQELNGDRKAVKKLKSKLKKILNLHREIFKVHTLFQRLFKFAIFLGLIHQMLLVGIASHLLFIDSKVRNVWLNIFICRHILEMFLLTISVEEARAQLLMIRWIHPEAYHTEENSKEFFNLLDVFYLHLNLYEFRMRPCGLFNVSNKLFLLYMSALISWLVYLAQSNLLTNNY